MIYRYKMSITPPGSTKLAINITSWYRCKLNAVIEWCIYVEFAYKYPQYCSTTVHILRKILTESVTEINPLVNVVPSQRSCELSWHWWFPRCTLYPKKYAHGFVVLCFVVVMQSFLINSHEVFIHIYQGCFAGTGAIVRLPQCQWSKPDGYGKISQCITTTKHSKAKTVCIFLGIYCRHRFWSPYFVIGPQEV